MKNIHVKLNPEKRKKAGKLKGIKWQMTYATRIYPRLYFAIQEILNKVKKEDRELTFEDRQEMVEKAYQLECIDKTNPKKAHEFVDKGVDRVLALLLLNGDIVSRQIKQGEILVTQDLIVNRALDEGDLKTANDANYKRMDVYRMLPRNSEDKIDNRSLFKLTQDASGNKEALLIGTPDECISIIRQALNPKKEIEAKKE